MNRNRVLLPTAICTSLAQFKTLTGWTGPRLGISFNDQRILDSVREWFSLEPVAEEVGVLVSIRSEPMIIILSRWGNTLELG